MSKPDTSIDPRILDSAKTEFLKCGYTKASLKVICQNAGVTTGALYKRYLGKEDLYCALVSAVAIEFKEQIKEKSLKLNSLSNDVGKLLIDCVNFVYGHFDTFKLLLECSAGTAYSDYLNELVEIVVRNISNSMRTEQQAIIVLGQKASPELLHIIVSAYISGFFEPVFHNMDFETAKVYETQFTHFFKVGWEGISHSQE